MAAPSSAYRHSDYALKVVTRYLVVLSPVKRDSTATLAAGAIWAESSNEDQIPSPKASRSEEELSATERLFRLIAEGGQPPKRHRMCPWLRRPARKILPSDPHDSENSPTFEQVIGRLVDVFEKFLAVKARAEQRNRALAVGLTGVAFAAAIAFFATGNVIAGCAFLSLPVLTLIEKMT